ncbi:NAD(P)(+) transhydrogenase (AB-specific) [Caballeronia arvi]|uniref:NAD(P)(+) transhydrogenase (AB-specific) n=1 Tax=Caballeronia arvi TaxID=1777135 RepID=A0A158KY06_9BURK|nr:NAD(P)(+) transhydrogenase (AB-specific) [Caballeronia arvi]
MMIYRMRARSGAPHDARAKPRCALLLREHPGLVACNLYQRFMPMLMTAAGAVKAARVLISVQASRACRPLRRQSVPAL